MNAHCDLGIVGLGVMGRNFLLNVSDHGFAVAGYDRNPDQVQTLREQVGERPIQCMDSLDDCVQQLRRPRAVMLLVPAGDAVDAVIDELVPMLSSGDIIIDGGNSHYKSTDRRAARLAEQDIQYLGVGVSGGEHGARNGPSIMPGGPRQAFEHLRSIFEAAAARAEDGTPCVTWLGPGSAGHFVKMVHNGIEYALMELIAETYDLMQRGLGLSDPQLHETYERWNATDVRSYLIEITAEIFRQPDRMGTGQLIDSILDEARQKGTGRWTSQDAMDLGVPVPVIDTAVAMRDLSDQMDQRKGAAKLYGPARSIHTEPQVVIDQLREALHASIIIAYAQGFALLRSASDHYGYDLDLEAVARIWRGGCIIRADLLEDIRHAFRSTTDLANLLLNDTLAGVVAGAEEHLRAVVRESAESGIPAPGFMAALGYFDALRSTHLPANLIQAQRDYFGDHTYERVDAAGTFHTDWVHG